MQENKVNTLLTYCKIITLLVYFFATNLYPQNVPDKYKRHFVKYSDKRSIMEKTLNIVGLSSQTVGRSFALIAGVSDYPNMLYNEKLKPAEEDIKKLQKYLDLYEFFDEIVVLQNTNVTTENFEYFLQTYFPKRLMKFPKSRFLFAYSGHGMTKNKNGYLLKSTAQNQKDIANSISLRIIRVYIDEVIREGHHVLVLLNSCYSGSFLKRAFGGEPKIFIPKFRGAHAITAGGSGEIAWHDPTLGTGSVFFEKMLAGLEGISDTDTNGLITVHELVSYLRREVQLFTDQDQNPQFGDISKDGSKGEFFFLNRQKQISQGIVSEWKSDRAAPMGAESFNIYNKAMEYYTIKDYMSAIPYLRKSAEAGNTDAMRYISGIYFLGLDVEKDYIEALYWILKMVKRDDVRGIAMLGVMYQYGFAIAQNYDEAVRLYRKAAVSDNVSGMVGLGRMYENGWGETKDYDLAVFWYKNAAEAGFALGTYHLGSMYQEGLGVSKDYNEAIHWYREAAKSGNEDAIKALSDLGEKLN